MGLAEAALQYDQQTLPLLQHQSRIWCNSPGNVGCSCREGRGEIVVGEIFPSKVVIEGVYQASLVALGLVGR